MKRRGKAPAKAQGEESVQLSEFIADRLLTAWEYYRWPESLMNEERFFRAEWKPQAYAAGEKVHHAGKYWQANDATVANDEPGVPSGGGLLLVSAGTYLRLNQAGDRLIFADADFSPWEEIKNFRKEISYTQLGLTPIEAVLGAWDRDPMADISAFRVDYKLGPDGVIFPPDYERTSVWIEYRRRAPDFAWSGVWEEQTYDAESVVYQAPEVYRATTATAAGDKPGESARWVKQEFPYILARAVKAGAAADAQGASGQEDKKLAEEGKFTELLDDQVVQITKVQGQTGSR